MIIKILISLKNENLVVCNMSKLQGPVGTTLNKIRNKDILHDAIDPKMAVSQSAMRFLASSGL